MQPEKTGTACTPDTPIDIAASRAAKRGHRTPFLPLCCSVGGVVCHGRQCCPQAPVFRAMLSGNAARHSCLRPEHQQALSGQDPPALLGGSCWRGLQSSPHQGQGRGLSCPKGRNWAWHWVSSGFFWLKESKFWSVEVNTQCAQWMYYLLAVWAAGNTKADKGCNSRPRGWAHTAP